MITLMRDHAAEKPSAQAERFFIGTEGTHGRRDDMKHLIFDCGGVLVFPRLGDWFTPMGAAEILGERARDLCTAKYLQAHRACADWLDETRLVGNVEEERVLRREYIKALETRMGWHMTLGEINRLADDFTDNARRYGLFDDVKTWLDRWKHDYSLGILSDAFPSILEFMKQYGIYDDFGKVVISTQVGATKPDARMYAAILDALDARPEDCLFVDDRAANLTGAVSAGMQAVQMARSVFLPSELWDGPVVHNFAELDRLLKG